MKRSLCMPCAVLLVLVGCAPFPHQTILVKDEEGRPIRGAGAQAPYPILLRNMLFPRDAPSSNSTDSRGRYEIYDASPGQQYILSAPGYEKKAIWFPQRDNETYVLRRKEQCMGELSVLDVFIVTTSILDGIVCTR